MKVLSTGANGQLMVQVELVPVDSATGGETLSNGLIVTTITAGSTGMIAFENVLAPARHFNRLAVLALI